MAEEQSKDAPESGAVVSGGGEPEKGLRRIEQAGFVLLVGSALFFLGLAVAYPDPYSRVWSLVVGHLVGGRVGNVALGFKFDFPSHFLFFQCSVQDFIVLLLFYPLLVTGCNKAIAWPYIGNAIEGVRQSANRHKGRIEPYGVVGLMLFVFFPLWSTGPLVGAVIGYLLGMRPWLIFTSVTIGNLLAVGFWVYFFQQMQAFNERWLDGVLAVLAVVLIGSALYFRVRKWRRPEGGDSDGGR